MAAIRTVIELEDRFSGVLNGIVNAVNMSVSAMERMQAVMNSPINISALGGVREHANRAVGAVRELNDALQGVRPFTPVSGQPQTAEIPGYRQYHTMDLFASSGAEHFEREARSADDMLSTLNRAQTHIAEAAAGIGIFFPNAAADMNGMSDRLQAVRRQIQAIENNPPDMGSDIANAESVQAAREREMLDRAAESINAGAADHAYLRLSQTAGDTERYIRDNVDMQGRFNRVIGEGIGYAGQLKGMIAGAVGALVGADGIKNAFGFAEDSTSRLNDEARLMGVLFNAPDENCVLRLELETAADTAGAVGEINAVQKVVDKVVVPVSAESGALAAAFGQIAEKASEIQGRGVYGDEAVIAAGVEFAAYFGDTDAVETMRDTLADHAVSMSGGEIVFRETVNYEADIGKLTWRSYDAMTRKSLELSDTQKTIIEGMAAQTGIAAALGEEYARMWGSYDAMTKKGIELSDTPKAIIEGMAAKERIAAALVEEYARMWGGMQAAVSRAAEKSWSGLYESMSNTPEGEVIQLNSASGNVNESIGGRLYPALADIIENIESNRGNIDIIIHGVANGLDLTAVIYNVCEAVDKLTGTANSGFGAICDWVSVMMQRLRYLAEFADTCLGRLGVNIDTSGFDLAKHRISELKRQYREFEIPAAAFGKGAAVLDMLRDKRSEDSFDFGAAWGCGVVDDIGSMPDGFGFGGLPDIPSPEEHADGLTAVGIGSGVEDIGGGIGDIKDLLEITEEDLKYLRDIAEQETVNRFTTAEITVEQHNTNNISSKMDLDGLVEGLTDKMSEAMFIMAEGVHV